MQDEKLGGISSNKVTIPTTEVTRLTGSVLPKFLIAASNPTATLEMVESQVDNISASSSRKPSTNPMIKSKPAFPASFVSKTFEL